jgi:hypothetical protein
MDKENGEHIHGGILFSNKEKQIMSFARKWTKPEIIMLSKTRQAQKDKCHPFSLKCGV